MWAGLIRLRASSCFVSRFIFQEAGDSALDVGEGGADVFALVEEYTNLSFEGFSIGVFRN